MNGPDESLGRFATLPSHLAYLVPYACRYALSTEDDIFSAIEHLSAEEREELMGLAERVRVAKHYPEVSAYLDQYEIDKFRDSLNLYFLFGMLDYLDLRFD